MRETRIVSAPVEVRSEGDGTATIAGYASLFNVPYEVMGYTEIVAPTAFTKTLRDKERGGYDLAVVLGHDDNRVLGTKDSGTARFATDELGLHYEADLDLIDPDGLSAQRKIATGKVRQSSFSFETIRDEWTYPEKDSTELPTRTLREVRLWETSPVLWGANPDTVVDVARAARSLAAAAHVEEAAAAAALEAGDLSSLKPPDPESANRDTDTTEAPDSAPPEGAPASTLPPEPERKRPVYLPGL